MPPLTIRILAIVTVQIHLFFLWSVFGDSQPGKEQELFGVPYDLLRLLVYPAFIIGYCLIGSNFTLGSTILGVSATLVILLQWLHYPVPPLIGWALVLTIWFTQIYPFVLCFRMLTQSKSSEERSQVGECQVQESSNHSGMPAEYSPTSKDRNR